MRGRLKASMNKQTNTPTGVKGTSQLQTAPQPQKGFFCDFAIKTLDTLARRRKTVYMCNECVWVCACVCMCVVRRSEGGRDTNFY